MRIQEIYNMQPLLMILLERHAPEVSEATLKASHSRGLNKRKPGQASRQESGKRLLVIAGTHW
jgi:hypothetical protein